MKTYRVAIVGLGRMGSTLDQSIASASRMSERLEVVAGAETIPERRTAFQEKWGVETVYEDYQEMIEKEEPDLVGGVYHGNRFAEAGQSCAINRFSRRCTRGYGGPCGECRCTDVVRGEGNILFRTEG